ncbi:MAG TPA: peptidase [Methylococcaceae bacterium]|jgi:putative proteasome-type protease|nr:peptidase [Methylococcaceae bacterium]
MTYCLAIKVNDGLVFASDSRAGAGVDGASVYSKMYWFELHEDRLVVLLASGSIATTQAVVSRIRRDLGNPGAKHSLNSAAYLFEAATYVGEISVRAQKQQLASMQRSGLSTEATFILGGQIQGQLHDLYMIYPQGNYIMASIDTPYLQIGETKYGKPVLVRMITPETSLEDAARCALVSLDSTMRSNISVGPPMELAIFERDVFVLKHHLSLNSASPFYGALQQQWGRGIRAAFDGLPRFDWETGGDT